MPFSKRIRHRHTIVAGQTTYMYVIIETLYLTKSTDKGTKKEETSNEKEIT